METLPIVLQLIVIWLMLGAINQTLKRVASCFEEYIELEQIRKEESEKDSWQKLKL